MPGVTRTGIDTAGGTVRGGGQSWVLLDGRPIAVVGDAVDPHAPCPDVAAHCAATMAAGSAWVSIDGIAICRAGDAASCGHAATGSDWMWSA